MKNVKFNKTRTVWVDNVRMFAIVCVMLGHTWRLIDCPLPLWLNDFILAFNMPLFVLLSGFVAVKSLKRIDTWTDFCDYVYKIAMRIMIPAVMFSCTANFLLNLAELDFKHMVMNGMIVAILLLLEFTPISHMRLIRRALLHIDSSHIACVLAIICGFYGNRFWFLIMLFSVMLVAAFSSVLNRKMMPVRIQPYSLPVIAFIVSLCFNFIHDKTSDFILYFLLGYYLSIVDVFKFKFINSKFAPWLFLFLGILLLECFDKDMMNFWDFHFLDFLTMKPFYLYILRHICALCICAFFVLVFKLFSVKYTIFSFMGTLTLPLYMVHAFTISIFKTLHIHLQLNDWQYMCYAIPTTLVWVIVCSFMILYTLRYEVIRKVYWGMAMITSIFLIVW